MKSKLRSCELHFQVAVLLFLSFHSLNSSHRVVTLQAKSSVDLQLKQRPVCVMQGVKCTCLLPIRP